MLLNVSKENKNEILPQIVVSETPKTSEIEWEYFSTEDVLYSLQKQFGIFDYMLPAKDKKARAISK